MSGILYEYAFNEGGHYSVLKKRPVSVWMIFDKEMQRYISGRTRCVWMSRGQAQQVINAMKGFSSGRIDKRGDVDRKVDERFQIQEFELSPKEVYG